MRKIRQLSGQGVNFFVNGFMFIHDKKILAFNLAQTAFHLDARSSQILLGNSDLEFFCQIFELLVYLFRFHISLVRLDLEKSADCVILSS